MHQSLTKCQTESFFVLHDGASWLEARQLWTVELEDKGREAASDVEVIEGNDAGARTRTSGGRGGA